MKHVDDADKIVYSEISRPSVQTCDALPQVNFTTDEIKNGISFQSEIEGSEISFACIKVTISGSLRIGNEIVFYINGSSVGSIGRNQGSFIDISEEARKVVVKGENILSCEINGSANVKGTLALYSDVIAENGSVTIENITDTVVSADMFGCNIEITRSTWWQGLSAEMLNNRKFFSDNGDGNPSGWVISGGRYITNDKENSICGSNYLVLASGDSASYSDSSVYLEKGATYQAEICVRKESDGKSQINLLIDGKKVGSCAVSKTNDEYDKFTISFTAANNVTDGTATFQVSGGEVIIYTVSLMNADNYYGMRPDCIESLKAISPASLRYPGGCCADRFDWEESLKPRNERKPMDADEEGYTGMGSFLYTETYNQDTMDFGLEEFFKLCEAVGAKPELTVSLVRGSAESAASLVKYCKDNNIEVSLWYVGNEVYYFGNELYKNPALAASRTNEYIKAMREVDSSVKIAIGFCSTTEEMVNWSKTYFTNVSEQYDVISVHYYYGSEFTDDNIFTNEQKLNEIAGVSSSYNSAVLDLISFLDENGLSNLKNKDICVDEWNWQFGAKGTSAMFIGNSCYLSNLINTQTKSNLTAACFFHPFEGHIEVSNNASEVTGAGYAFNLFKQHINGTICSVNTSGDYKAVVTKSANTVTVTITNPHMASKYINLENIELLGHYTSADVRMLVSSGLSTTDTCTVSSGLLKAEKYTTDDLNGFLVPGLSTVQIILYEGETNNG